MTSATERLFVYGTLLRPVGHPMHTILAARSRFLGPALFPGRMYDIGGYPGVVYDAGARPMISGELYELIDSNRVLMLLDRYEGCTDMADPGAEYRRERHAVLRPDGSSVDAWIYLYNRSTGSLRPVAHGDYLRR